MSFWQPRTQGLCAVQRLWYGAKALGTRLSFWMFIKAVTPGQPGVTAPYE